MRITADQLRNLYLDFFKSKGHAVISGASLIPENDPTVLFTTAGMHPLVPYLMGKMPHPAGTRLTDVQKCVRTGDIDEVGDSAHLTFFEMLGNWSLNDYFKKEAISWSFEFLTTKLGFSPDRLSVTVFRGEGKEGEEGYIPADEEAVAIWKSLGIPDERIYRLPREDNWWGPAGETGPCGPDTEMFIDTGKEKCGPDCRPGCHCGKYIEIWNDVFMQFNKTAEGKFEPLGRHNVDTGMGVERTICMMNGCDTVYDTDVFAPIMAKIKELSGKDSFETPEDVRSSRVVADHMRTATFILGDQKGGVTPGNVGANYVLRRLIRSAVRHARRLGIAPGFTEKMAATIVDEYKHVYPELEENRERVVQELLAEETRFGKTLDEGKREFDKTVAGIRRKNEFMSAKDPAYVPDTQISGKQAFRLYDTYGYPLEMTQELAREIGFTVDVAGYQECFKAHQELSRANVGSAKSGLAEHSEETTALHTATHLLHKALKIVLGDHCNQKGSNITAERLRLDFTHGEKMTPEQIKAVEDLVNEQIKADLPVYRDMMTLEEARAAGATALFSSKYTDEKLSVYTMGRTRDDFFSKEVCTGPHVEHTGVLGHFKIKKEESSSAGVRRIKAVLEK
ncbi:MAG: alanine--tRNA ligase [Kiritimatiellae bacterium]|nr:alanine--tRNA ligase [Kiritimatiellia bacterium]